MFSREFNDNVKKARSRQITECFPYVETVLSDRPDFSAYAYSPPTVLSIDNWSPYYAMATLAMKYNSGVWFQPFLSSVGFTTLYNNAETRRNARKVQPPVFNLLNNWNQAASFVCPTILPLPKRWQNPPCNFQPLWMSGVGSCGSLMRRFVRAHKTHLDPSWPSSRYSPSLTLSPFFPISLLFCSDPDPSVEVNKDGQIMERSHGGYEDY